MLNEVSIMNFFSLKECQYVQTHESQTIHFLWCVMGNSYCANMFSDMSNDLMINYSIHMRYNDICTIIKSGYISY